MRLRLRLRVNLPDQSHTADIQRICCTWYGWQKFSNSKILPQKRAMYTTFYKEGNKDEKKEERASAYDSVMETGACTWTSKPFQNTETWRSSTGTWACLGQTLIPMSPPSRKK